MVSKKTKINFAAEKTKRAANTLLPIFKRESLAEFANEILREDEGIRRIVMMNPAYRGLLEQKIAETFKEYKYVLRGAKLVDSWDRVTSSLGLLADAAGPFSAGLGNLLSVGEEVAESIPKAVYAIYYGAKTKDYRALPYWTAAEAASFIPYIGDAIDMTNIYINRARKLTKQKVRKEMRRAINPRLARMAA